MKTADDSAFGTIDGDGHVFENASGIYEHFPREWRDCFGSPAMRNLFPALDNLHHSLSRIPDGSFQDPGLEGWVKALSAIGLDAAVLYPSHGLSIGRVVDEDLAVYTCTAYNDWLAEAYIRRDSRFKGIGLIPMQDPAAAVTELRRCVSDLGFVGALLPATGLKAPLGDSIYWPVYAEADRLGCCLSVHGGSYNGLGLDHFNSFAAIHSLGHPLGVAIALASMTFNGVFNRFPETHFAFLEGGVGWFIMALERFDSSYSAFPPLNPRDKLLDLGPNARMSDYILQLMGTGQVAIGIEGDEQALSWLVRRFGSAGLLYSSDFPHEVSTASCAEAIEEICGMDIDDDSKMDILSRNAKRFYGINS